jgi:RHS repeat-associated protein
MDYAADPSLLSCSGGGGSPDPLMGTSSADHRLDLAASGETTLLDHRTWDGPDGFFENAVCIEYTGLDVEADSDTALLYCAARCYDPTPGRWLHEEPIAFAASDANLHRYVTEETD